MRHPLDLIKQYQVSAILSLSKDMELLELWDTATTEVCTQEKWKPVNWRQEREGSQQLYLCMRKRPFHITHTIHWHRTVHTITL